MTHQQTFVGFVHVNIYLYMLYSHIHKHNTNISGNIVNNNDDFNERTNTLLYKKYISHTLFSKGLTLVVCKRWVRDGDRLLHIDKHIYNCLKTTCFRCSSAYLHRCISWLMARSMVNILHSSHSYFSKFYVWNFSSRLSPSPTHTFYK